MNKLYMQFRNMQAARFPDTPKTGCERRTGKNGCEMLELMGLNRIGDWVKPKRRKEGPKSASPFCTDCGGCKPSLIKGAGCRGASFFPVEFARDVEHPSSVHNRSTIAYSPRRSLHSPPKTFPPTNSLKAHPHLFFLFPSPS